jgi:hypothetical protein
MALAAAIRPAPRCARPEHLDWAAAGPADTVQQARDTWIEPPPGVGFQLVGTIPGGFDHPKHGRVGLHIMYCPF